MNKGLAMNMIKISTSSSDAEYAMNLDFFQGMRIQESAFNEGYAVLTYIFNNFTIEDEFDTQGVPFGVIFSCILDKINIDSCKFISAKAVVYKLKQELEAQEREFSKLGMNLSEGQFTVDE